MTTTQEVETNIKASEFGLLSKKIFLKSIKVYDELKIQIYKNEPF